MPTNKRSALIIFAAVAAIGIAAVVMFLDESTLGIPDLNYTPNEEMVDLASEIVHINVQPEFPFSFNYMTEGVQQHLDRDYTYDVIPYQLKGGLLFQGIHRPPAGTSLQIELLQPATVYFFFHSKTDGGYSRIFEKLPVWKRSADAPQYDVKNGNHGLQMTMYEIDAQPGILYIPATTSDRASFSIVFQSAYGKLAEPNS